MTAQKIYNITMALMDEMKNDGTPDFNSTKDYLARTPGILTILQTEIAMAYARAGMEINELDAIEKMEDDVDLENNVCVGVLPYGLAARLLGQEDSTLSNYFSNLYASNLNDAVKSSEDRAIAIQEKRVDVYSSSLRVGD